MLTPVDQIPSQCDVVVIGGGIGGLSCANYLAKAGVKVVLLEKHYIVGGCASSFQRGPYYFDAAAHSLGSCRPDGQIGKFIRDHDLDKSLNLIRINPTDVVVTKSKEVFFYTNIKQTVDELTSKFPQEAAAISRFVSYINEKNTLQLFVELKDITFSQLLDFYFKDEELKSVFSMLLGNIGLSSASASALTSVFLYREYIFDGGYYPKGGMQRFSDVLLERFQSYGGVASLLTPVTKICTGSTGKVSGVIAKVLGRHEVEIQAKVVIANCDPFQAAALLDNSLSHASSRKIRVEGKCTPSAFMLHLGLKGQLPPHKYNCPVWSYRNGHIDQFWGETLDGGIEWGRESFVFFNIPSLHDPDLLPEGYHSLQAIVGVPTLDRAKWKEIRDRLADDVMSRIDYFLPDIASSVDTKFSATPSTIQKYTQNHDGAIYGFASTVDQVNSRRWDKFESIEGLYFAGHWSGLPSGFSGIPTVITAGKNASRRAVSLLISLSVTR